MYLKFEEIEIEGFQSIGRANIKLNDNGIVAVKGINKYEDNTNSNGSGKSSLFESILWCIYGKTSKSVSKVTNKNYDGGCQVTLNFSINDNEYKLIRSQNHKKLKSTVILIQNGNDISGRNKTDTENILSNDVMKEFTPDIFQSVIFLSQGFNNRFGVLQPSKRKERLETISQISEKIDSFKSKLDSVEASYSTKYISYSNQASAKQGERNYIEKDIYRTKSDIEDYENKIKSIDADINVDKLREKLQTLHEMQKESSDKISDVSQKLYSNRASIQSLKNDLSTISLDGNKYKKALEPVQILLCPTCRQKINKSISESLVKEYTGKIEKLRSDYVKVSKEIQTKENEHSQLKNQLDDLNRRKSNIDSRIKELNDSILRNSVKVRDMSSDKKRLTELKASLPDIDKEINDIQASANENQTYMQVTQHCKQLVSKQFRNFLLQGVIDFMNARLETYSEYLYSNKSDIIRLVSDSSKLDIMVGDTLYESLSGGEARKVDLALALAQRDLSLNISCSSSNILILDEVMDNLDEHSSTCAFDMILKSVEDLSSVYIISHNNYAIPYDSILTVTKEKDKVSHIEFSE